TELAKIGLLAYLATIIPKKGEKFRYFKKGLLPVLIVTGVVCFLIVLQNDLGSMLIVFATAGIVIMVGGARFKHLFGLAGAALLPVPIVTGVLCFPSVPQDRLGSRLTVFATAGIVIMVGAARFKHLCGLAGAALVIGGGAILR